MFEDEIWKPIEGYEGIYDVSNCGRVRKSMFAKRSPWYGPGEIVNGWVETSNKKQGNKYYFPRIGLSKEKHRVYRIVPNLVAEAFLPAKPQSNYQLNHIDGNPFNNHISNLEWVTVRENNLHAVYTGLKRQCIPARLIDSEGNHRDYPSLHMASYGIGRGSNYIARCLRNHRPIRGANGDFYTLEYLDKEKYFSEQKEKYIREHTSHITNHTSEGETI